MSKRGLFLGMIFYTWVAQVHAAGVNVIDTAKVRSYSAEDSRNDLNPFQRDCQAVLKPVESYLHTVQSQRTPNKGLYQLRMSGHLSGAVKVKFASDRIAYVGEEGETKDYNFHLKKILIAQNQEGEFSFSLMLKAGQVVIPLTFSEMFEQHLNFHIKISKEGKVLDAVLKPAWDPETRKKLCLRDHLKMAAGMGFFSFDQSFQSIDGKVSSVSNQLPSLSLNYTTTQSPLSEQVYDFTYTPGKLRGENQFQKDFQYSWLTAAYHSQSRNLSWNTSWRNLLVQPFVRYGGQVHSIPYISIQKADEADVKTFNLFNVSGGGGVNITNEKNWLIEIYMNIQYPLYSTLNSNYKTMFDGSISMNKAFNQKYYYGLTWHGQYNEMGYTAQSALNTSGTTQFITSNIELILGYFF